MPTAAPRPAHDGRPVCVCVLGAAAETELQSLVRTVGGASVLAVFPADAPAARSVPNGVTAVVADGAGGGALAAAAAKAAGPADVAFVLAGTKLPPRWLDRLAVAAGSDPLAVIAVGLTLEPVPGDAALLDAPAGHPRVPASTSPVALVRQAGLSAFGLPDPSLTAWPEVLTDLIQRATLTGMTAVVASDVVIAPVAATVPLDGALAERYPWLPALVEEADRAAAPPARAAALARRRLSGLTVTLDLRSLGPVRMGTQTHALGLALALADADAADLRFLVAHDLDPDVAAQLTASPRTSLLPYERALDGAARTSVVHRPQQVNTAHDLELLQPLGERLVVTHQDLIGYRNPAYHARGDEWLQHRRTTRYALQVADRVLFFSAHARDDAVAEDLVDPAWTDVVGLGVDEPGHPRAQRPVAVPELGANAGDFLLCLGADLRHKHRTFAIDLFAALVAEHGYDGRLVLAGPELELGGTRGDEDARLAAAPALAGRVLHLGAVAESEKRWLLEHAALVLYPTIDEGFGLLPFEAAAAGTPCAWAPAGALPEVLPGAEPVLVPWDAARSAERVLRLLHDPGAAEQHVAAVRAAARAHRWRATAERVLAAYDRALAAPRRGVAWEARDRATVTFDLDRLLPHVAQLEDDVRTLHAFVQSVGEDGARLVGPHGLIAPEDRRALLSIVARPALRKPFLAALRLGYRMGRRSA